jgi:hypothetical protein
MSMRPADRRRCHHELMANRTVEKGDRARRENATNEAARREILRIDRGRSLGENLEQADSLIKAAFELARGLGSRRR